MEMDTGSEERQLLVDRLGTTTVNMDNRIEQSADFTELVRRFVKHQYTLPFTLIYSEPMRKI